MADLSELVTSGDVQTAWRPLKPAEAERATYLIGAAVRKISRRWRDVNARLTAGTLDAEDVTDVVVGLVLQALPLAPVPGAKSWQISSGAESRSVTLGSAGGDLNRMELLDWMVEIFDDTATTSAALPVFSAPDAPGWPDPAQRSRPWPGSLL